MNSLTVAQQKMTSREIAELTGKEHNHVMRDIRVMLVELHGEVGRSSFGSSYLNSQNKEQPQFQLPKREAMILVSGYSIQMRAKIIDRWQELEAEAAKPAMTIPQTLPEALRLAADLAEQKAVAEAKLAIAAPKAEALDLLATPSGGSLSLRDSAKSLGIPEREFIRRLLFARFIYRQANGELRAFAGSIHSQNFEHKLTLTKWNSGRTHEGVQVRVTERGLARMALHLTVKAKA